MRLVGTELQVPTDKRIEPTLRTVFGTTTPNDHDKNM